MKWAIVLHFYQPPVQDLAVTKQVVESSYLPVLDILLHNPDAKVTLNISGCLLAQLSKLKQERFFEKIKELIARDQIELLNSAAYHPVLPLVSTDTLVRQVEKNRQLIIKHLGVEPDGGFFIPELAVNDELLTKLQKLCVYTTIDQSGIVGEYQPLITSNGLKCFVNHRQSCDVFRTYAKELSGEKLCSWIINTVGLEELVTISDVEAFGHHYEERLKALEEVFNNKEIEFVKLKELQNIKAKDVKVNESSWQNLPDDKHTKSAFWLWKNTDNHLQAEYWELISLAEEIYHRYKNNIDANVARIAAEHLDAGFSSCYSYWMSNWPWWHPDLVEKGLQQIVKSCRTIEASREDMLFVEEKYHNLLKELWGFHWSGQVEKNYEQYEVELKKITADLPELT